VQHREVSGPSTEQSVAALSFYKEHFMRMLRYMAWVFVASLTIWSVGCGGTSGPSDADNPEKLKSDIDTGSVANPMGAPVGQERERGGDVPEAMSGAEGEAGKAGTGNP
jgi:hypothetical protein